jgi:hypothetical protein
MVHTDKKMPIFTKNVSYVTHLVLIDSQESKESGDTKIVEIGHEASYGLRHAGGIRSRSQKKEASDRLIIDWWVISYYSFIFGANF